MTSTTAERLAHLYAATTALTSEQVDEDPLFERIVREAAALTRARYAALGLLGADGHLIRFVTHGLTPAEYETLKDQPPHGRGILGALLREGRPLRLDDLTADPRSVGFPAGHPPMRTFLGVPLRLAGDVIGRLYMTESEQGVFDEEDEHIALGFAAAASVAIANTRLNAEVRQRGQAAAVAAGQLRAMLDSLERGIVMTDADGRMVVASERLGELLALDDPLVGRMEEELASCFVAPAAFLSALGLERGQPHLSFSDELALAGEGGRVIRRYGSPVLAPDGSWLGRLAVY